jgi:transcriptional regulator with XRE-family HTH domain
MQQPYSSEREQALNAQVERMFASRMKQRREELGVSQATLAMTLTERYGIKIDSTAITRIEQNATGKPGARVIRLGEAAAVADSLQTTLPDMLRTVPPLWERVQEARKELEQAAETEIAASNDRARAAERLEQLEKRYREETNQAQVLKDLERAGALIREVAERHGVKTDGQE